MGGVLMIFVKGSVSFLKEESHLLCWNLWSSLNGQLATSA